MWWISLAVAQDGTWNLADLYANEAAWEADLAAVEARLPELEGCEGQLRKELESCLTLRFDLQRQLYRAEIWASLGSDVDTRDDVWRGRNARANLLDSRFYEVASFFEPEILSLGAKKVNKAAARPSMAPYRAYLRNTLTDAAHTLDPERESLLASMSPMFMAPGEVYGVFKNAELPWPELTIRGATVRMDPSAYTLHRADSDAGVRTEVFNRFFGALAQFEETLGTNLAATIQGHWIVARTRAYPSSVAAAMDSDHLPPAIYDTLVAETNRQLPILHRYLKLRARMIGIEKPAYSDLYVPLVTGDRRWTLAEAESLAVVSAAPLGDAYVGALKQGFAERWMDAYPKPGKTAGAYMNGAAYDVHPYVLMNFNSDYESVTTLAHEFGHAVHSALSSKSQPYPTADYATFIAEIASTGAEALLIDHMLKHAKDDDERLFYLGNALEGLRTTYFRQAQLAEFELKIHQQVEKGEPLTGSGLSATYLDIVNRYYGVAEGVTRMEPAWAIEWAYIPHFYYNFYVYQYATSIAASSLLAERVLAGEAGAQQRYLDLLRAGGSDDPYILLNTAGVDMASPAPYQAIGRRMERLMSEVETILARRAR